MTIGYSTYVTLVSRVSDCGPIEIVGPYWVEIKGLREVPDSLIVGRNFLSKTYQVLFCLTRVYSIREERSPSPSFVHYRWPGNSTPVTVPDILSPSKVWRISLTNHSLYSLLSHPHTIYKRIKFGRTIVLFFIRLVRILYDKMSNITHLHVNRKNEKVIYLFLCF